RTRSNRQLGIPYIFHVKRRMVSTAAMRSSGVLSLQDSSSIWSASASVPTRIQGFTNPPYHTGAFWTTDWTEALLRNESESNYVLFVSLCSAPMTSSRTNPPSEVPVCAPQALNQRRHAHHQ